jgi:hypothetical protein
MTDRPFTRADYLALKAATRYALESAGTLAEVAARTRVDPAQLSRYGNPENSQFVPLDVAMDLDHLAGAPVILRAYAERMGFELVPHEARVEKPAGLAEQIARVGGEAGDVLRVLADTYQEGVTPARARVIDEQASEAIDALNDVREDARQVIAGANPTQRPED